jgi:hypothetical protein
MKIHKPYLLRGVQSWFLPSCPRCRLRDTYSETWLFDHHLSSDLNRVLRCADCGFCLGLLHQTHVNIVRVHKP